MSQQSLVHWNRVKGKVRAGWEHLTDNELNRTQGNL